MQPERRSRPEPFLSAQVTLIYFSCAVGIALLTLWFGQWQFGAYDASMLIDAGWRMSLGQLPYRDFPGSLPPLFLLAAGWSVRLFGDHWRSFNLGGDCTYLLCVGLGWLSVRLAPVRLRAAERAQLLLAFLLAISVPHLVTGHVWHSVDTSMLAVTLMLAFTLQALALTDGITTVPLPFQAVAIAVSALLWLGKPNIAVPAQSLLLLFAVCATARWRSLLFWLRTTLMGAALACGLLVVCGISPAAVVLSYVHVDGRPSVAEMLVLFLSLTESLLCYEFLLFAIPLLLWCAWLHRRQPRLRTLLALVLVGCLLTLAGMATNWDVRSNDMGPIVFAAAFAATMPATQRWTRAVRVALCVLLVQVGLLAFWNAEQRTRMRSVGKWATRSTHNLETRTDPFFGRFAVSPTFWTDVIDPIDRDRLTHPSTNVYFGPLLEFEYARCHLPSPRALPVWWHRGSSYPRAMEEELTDAWLAHRFDTVYLASTLRLPDRLKSEILARYQVVGRGGDQVTIWRLRPQVQLTQSSPEARVTAAPTR